MLQSYFLTDNNCIGIALLLIQVFGWSNAPSLQKVLVGDILVLDQYIRKCTTKLFCIDFWQNLIVLLFKSMSCLKHYLFSCFMYVLFIPLIHLMLAYSEEKQGHMSHIKRIFMSCIKRKPAFCICENKATDQRLCFGYIDSTIHLLPKSEISSL